MEAPKAKGKRPTVIDSDKTAFCKVARSLILLVQMSKASTLSIIRPSTWPVPDYTERCEAISMLIAWNKGLQPKRSEGSESIGIRLYSGEPTQYSVAVPCGDDGCTAWWVFNADHREGAHLNG